MEPALLALAGAAAGLAAMALPGVHVNALALGVLALAPDSGAAGSAFLLGALAGAPFGLALSSMLSERRGADAAALECWGAFAGLALALPLSMLARPLLLLVEPRLGAAMPWLLAGFLVLLVATERARPRVHRRLVVAPRGFGREIEGILSRPPSGWRVGKQRVGDPFRLLDARDVGAVVRVCVEPEWSAGPLSRPAGWALAALVLALSGALGVVALRMGAASPVGLPASALLPLLAGLFAAPGLILLLRAERGGLPGRVRRPRGILRRALPGAMASSLLGLLPGVSPSHVTPLAGRSEAPDRWLVTVGAVNGGAVAFGLLAWHALGKARSGALVAAQALSPAARWRGWAPTPEILREAALVLLAAGFACLAARALGAPLGRLAARAPPAALGLGGLALVVAAVALTCGVWGLGVLAVAALVGLAPIRLGVRRALLMGCILVPATLWAWGMA